MSKSWIVWALYVRLYQHNSSFNLHGFWFIFNSVFVELLEYSWSYQLLSSTDVQTSYISTYASLCYIVQMAVNFTACLKSPLVPTIIQFRRTRWAEKGSLLFRSEALLCQGFRLQLLGSALLLLIFWEFPDPCIPATPVSMALQHCQNTRTIALMWSLSTRLQGKCTDETYQPWIYFSYRPKQWNAVSCGASIFCCNSESLMHDLRICECTYPVCFARNYGQVLCALDWRSYG